MRHYAEQRRDGLRPLRRPADAHLGDAADGGRRLERRRPQLGADRRRRRLRQPAQRRGHRLRPRDRSAGGRRRSDGRDLATAWPALLREHYGEAFSIARRLAGLVTVPRLLPTLGPAGMRSDWLMTLALRWMGNLVTDEDRDRAARVWRWAGRRSVRLDHAAAVQLSRRAGPRVAAVDAAASRSGRTSRRRACGPRRSAQRRRPSASATAAEVVTDERRVPRAGRPTPGSLRTARTARRSRGTGRPRGSRRRAGREPRCGHAAPGRSRTAAPTRPTPSSVARISERTGGRSGPARRTASGSSTTRWRSRCR